jgi:hypothetical protein
VAEALRINHVRVASRSVNALKQWFADEHGLGAFDMIPLGTPRYRQAFVPLPGLTGFELFGDFQGDHPFAAELSRRGLTVCFVGWALRTDDIDAVGDRLEITPSPVRSWVDPRGESFAARWLTGPDVGLPYFIQYLTAPAEWPEVPHSRPAHSIAAVQVSGSDADLAALERWMGSVELAIERVATDGPLQVESVVVTQGDKTTRLTSA